jgi:hypothetical protein
LYVVQVIHEYITEQFIRSAIIHVVPDDDSSYFSLALALITLSPILLMVSPAYIVKCQLFSAIQASYAALAVQTREFLVIVMWAGQLFGELLNWVIKRAIKQDRPIRAAFTAISWFHSEDIFPRTHWEWIRLSLFSQSIHGIFCIFPDVPSVFSTPVFIHWIFLSRLFVAYDGVCCPTRMVWTSGLFKVCTEKLFYG